MYNKVQKTICKNFQIILKKLLTQVKERNKIVLQSPMRLVTTKMYKYENLILKYKM